MARTDDLYTFQIIFGGLCAMVPDNWEKPRSLDVVLVDTENYPKNKLDYYHEPHSPVIRFELGDVLSPAGLSGTGETVWHLKKEQLTLEFHWVDDKTTGTPKPPKFEIDKSARKHIPRIYDFLPGGGELNPEVLGKTPGNFVAARFHLETGSLALYKPSKYFGKPVTAEMIPPHGKSIRMDLAHQAALTLELPRSVRVSIVLSKIKTGKETRRVTFRPGKKKEEMRVKVFNLCCGYYEEESAYNQGVPGADVDFECFYLLSKNFDDLVAKSTVLPVPVPVKYAHLKPSASGPPPDGGGAEPIRCTMSFFEAPKQIKRGRS